MLHLLIVFFPQMECSDIPYFSLLISFRLKFTLPDIKIAITAYFWGPAVWNNVFYLWCLAKAFFFDQISFLNARNCGILFFDSVYKCVSSNWRLKALSIERFYWEFLIWLIAIISFFVFLCFSFPVIFVVVYLLILPGVFIPSGI